MEAVLGQSLGALSTFLQLQGNLIGPLRRHLIHLYLERPHPRSGIRLLLILSKRLLRSRWIMEEACSEHSSHPSMRSLPFLRHLLRERSPCLL